MAVAVPDRWFVEVREARTGGNPRIDGCHSPAFRSPPAVPVEIELFRDLLRVESVRESFDDVSLPWRRLVDASKRRNAVISTTLLQEAGCGRRPAMELSKLAAAGASRPSRISVSNQRSNTLDVMSASPQALAPLGIRL
jgi:hypothetical protein